MEAKPLNSVEISAIPEKVREDLCTMAILAVLKKPPAATGGNHCMMKGNHNNEQ